MGGIGGLGTEVHCGACGSSTGTCGCSGGGRMMVMVGGVLGGSGGGGTRSEKLGGL